MRFFAPFFVLFFVVSSVSLASTATKRTIAQADYDRENLRHGSYLQIRHQEGRVVVKKGQSKVLNLNAKF